VALGDIDGAELERTAAAITKAGGTAVTLAGDLTEERRIANTRHPPAAVAPRLVPVPMT